MRFSKFLAAACVALSITAVSQSAQAIPITAVWTGTVTTASDSSVVGQTITMSFSYTSEAVGASTVYNFGDYTQFIASYNPNFYSSASMSLSGGLSIAITTPAYYSTMLIGDPAHTFKSIYYNDLTDYSNGYARLVAYFYNTAVGGLTGNNSLDPSLVFSHNVSSTDPSEQGIIYYEFYDADGIYHYGRAETSFYGQNANISVALNGSSASVPAPGALALLGLGLLGIAGLRRRKAA